MLALLMITGPHCNAARRGKVGAGRAEMMGKWQSAKAHDLGNERCITSLAPVKTPGDALALNVSVQLFL
jgi:hypothetical protein